MELNLALFKKHVRADDFTEDDEYLGFLLDTAKDTVLAYTRRTAEEITANGWGNMYAQAVLMLGAHWYNQRESVSSVQMHEVPDSVSVLVKPMRKLV